MSSKLDKEKFEAKIDECPDDLVLNKSSLVLITCKPKIIEARIKLDMIKSVLVAQVSVCVKSRSK